MRIQERLRALCLTVVATAVVSGCDDSTGIRASFNNTEARLAVYPMNSAAATLPAAVALRSATAVRIDASFLFDLAFDLNANGKVDVYTQRRVASELVAAHRVGLQVMPNMVFDQVEKSPASGFVYDSLLSVIPGEVIVAEVVEQACGQSFLGPTIKAKLKVDSIIQSPKTIFLRVLVNPNCGFRSLVPGTPKD